MTKTTLISTISKSVSYTYTLPFFPPFLPFPPTAYSTLFFLSFCRWFLYLRCFFSPGLVRGKVSRLNYCFKKGFFLK